VLLHYGEWHEVLVKNLVRRLSLGINHRQPSLTIFHWFVSKQRLCKSQARNQGAFAPPEIFKTLHGTFDICRNFQRIKMKFYIVIIFKKPYLSFSLFYWLIISLQDLS